MGRTNISVIFSLIILFLHLGCGPKDGHDLRSDQGEWLLKGSVQNADYANGDVVAYNSQGHSYNSHLVGPNFALYLPENDHYALFFVKKGKDVPRSFKAITANEYVGRDFATLVFENDQETSKLSKLLRLPLNSKAEVIDLGEIEVRRGTAVPENNPSKFLDFDGDHINDYFDIDAKGDGFLDSEQPVENKEIAICHTEAGQNLALKISLSNIMDHKSHGDYTGPCQMSAKPRMPSITNTPAPVSTPAAQPTQATTAPAQPAAPTAPAAATDEKKGGHKRKHDHDDEEKDEEDGDRKKGKKKDKKDKKDKCDDEEEDSDDGKDLDKGKDKDKDKGGKKGDRKPVKKPKKKPDAPNDDAHDPMLY